MQSTILFYQFCQSVCLSGTVSKQAVRVATQYAPPLSSPWAPKRLARRRADAT